MKKHLVRIALGVMVVLIFAGHAGRYYQIPLIDRFENIVYDARLRLTMANGIDPRIVIIDIDEKSLAAEGRWPWRRDKLGAMLDQLFDHYKVGIVGFDVVFAERDESSGLGILRDLGQKQLKGDAQYQAALKEVAPQLEYDRVFAEKLRNRAVVLGYYFSDVRTDDGKGRVSGMLPKPVLPAGTFKGKNIAFTSWAGYGANLEEFQEAAASGGHFNPWPDEDGVTRRVPMLAEYNGAYYESLSMAMIRLGLGSPPVVPGFPSDKFWSRDYPGLEWIDIGSVRVPIDNLVTALVPYRGKQGSFKYVSATDVLHGTTPVEDLKNKIILVGTTAPGLFDLRAAPVASVYPGVEIHANLLAGMLDGTIKQRPPYVLGAEVLLLLLSGTAMALVLPLVNPLRATMLTIVVVGAVFATNVLVWTEGNLVLPLASGLLMIGVLFALNMSYGFFVESRAKRQITGLFGQYVPPELVDEMSNDPEAFSMEGESRELSVLFTDVRGFTTISEGLDPKELSRLMNEFLTPLTRVIYKHRGTIDKYMGDCIMAFWGAPLIDPQHARNAVLAGLEMHRVLEELQPHFREQGWPPIRIGVGVNTGRMSVGNMGSEIRLAYTVMGDAVNLASRLEGITKQYGAKMIVGEDTRAQVQDVVFRELDRVKVKGKEAPVAIYEPVGLAGEVDKSTQDELKLWAQVLKLYRSRDWDMAELQLINLTKANPASELYSLFLGRIAFLRSNPPEPGWDGSWKFETK
ncbi:MAG TPA: adenylate/guanylate cyclase domain-containing protein [Burkholderiales bacterium]|nr:adenylate/guanylate cyclase domain-containing protein [Burkholderiales bacterium]